MCGCVVLQFSFSEYALIYNIQETRYGSPAIDLSFFMYMNMDPVNHAPLWDKLLKYYHESLMKSLLSLLQCADPNVAELQPYRSVCVPRMAFN